MTETRSYQALWESCDGLSDAEISVRPPEGPYPALVSIEANFGSSITSDDADELAAQLITASIHAQTLNLQHPQASTPPRSHE